jgi:hypothetical protein
VNEIRLRESHFESKPKTHDPIAFEQMSRLGKDHADAQRVLGPGVSDEGRASGWPDPGTGRSKQRIWASWQRELLAISASTSAIRVRVPRRAPRS